MEINEMKDRELLELAAKACGYDTSHRWNAERLLLLLDPPVIDLCIQSVSTGWNPLTNDGDALRLAVELGISVNPGSKTNRFVVVNGDCGQILEERGPDPCASTRRAIVRAAAEIGKAMK